MKLTAFLTGFALVDRIVDQLELTFVAERRPPLYIANQKILVAAEIAEDYSSRFSHTLGRRSPADFRCV